MATEKPTTTTILDLSQDVATLLRKGTATAHEMAEESKGATWLTRGELEKLEYVRFLIMLWQVYSTLEEALEHHSSNPVLSPTYNSTLLARAPAISADIATLLLTSESSWKQHPYALSVLRDPPKPLIDYTRRIQTLSSERPPLLLAHAYVRYLGDLSGGQVIRHNIAKAYDLDTTSGHGIEFYEFKKLAGGGVATIGDMRKIKEWYRAGMNSGVGDDQKLKSAMVEEANVAFRLNHELFTLLRPPSSKKVRFSVTSKDVSTPDPNKGGPLSRIFISILLLSLGYYVFEKYLPSFIPLT